MGGGVTDNMQLDSLAPGFYGSSPAHVATVVTNLEMLARPEPRPERAAGNWILEERTQPSPAEYRRLYRLVGEDWLWFSRLMMPDDELTAVIHDPLIEIRRLHAPEGEGFLELDFRSEGECELAFFGLSRGLIGSGAGRWLMNRALEIAWSRPIERLWLHTCTMDAPAALDFYRRSGFIPVSREIEIAPDPRLSGILPRMAAPHIPCLTDN